LSTVRGETLGHLSAFVDAFGSMPRGFLVAEGVDDKWLVVKKARTGLGFGFHWA
jgi:hypothetical protein